MPLTSPNPEPSISPADRQLVDYLRRHAGSTVDELVAWMGVTATAVRQRLGRLMDQGLVVRESQSAGRGRPRHQYSLTAAGLRSGGNNYRDLAHALWDEVRGIADPNVKRGLLSRLAQRLAGMGLSRGEVRGSSVAERMESLAGAMQDREIPFAVERQEGLPVLTALACPYPDLAEQDRGICALEKMLFSELLGADVKLSDCRLDGTTCCTFAVGSGADD
jgi:predicted ArsR family transcriptional regulator